MRKYYNNNYYIMNNTNESISVLTECLKSVPIDQIRNNP